MTRCQSSQFRLATRSEIRKVSSENCSPAVFANETLSSMRGAATRMISRFTAMTVALAYNWWSLFVRLAHPKARLEAITSRPFLLSGIGRLTSHSGQAHLSITPMHARAKDARALLTAASQRLKAWKSTAEQLPFASVWQRVCEFITTHVTGFNWLARQFQPLLTHCT